MYMIYTKCILQCYVFKEFRFKLFELNINQWNLKAHHFDIFTLVY